MMFVSSRRCTFTKTRSPAVDEAAATMGPCSHIFMHGEADTLAAWPAAAAARRTSSAGVSESQRRLQLRPVHTEIRAGGLAGALWAG